MRIAFIIAALSLAAQSALAKPAYLGEWAFDRNGCQSGDIMATITAQEFGMPDATCKITSITGGRGVWRAKVTCSGEGATPNDVITMTATAKHLTLQFRSSGNQRTVLVRCK